MSSGGLLLTQVAVPHICRTSARSFSRFSFSSSNVDKKETQHFTKLSNDWWDPNGPLKALMSMNRLRVPFIRDGLLAQSREGGGNPEPFASQPLKGLRVLDVGCGGGLLCEPLARLGADVTGIDPTEACIEIALSHALRDPDFGDNLTYSCTTVETLSTALSSAFDGVVASEVIEHVPDPVEFLKHCVTVLKPGGSLFLTTINKTVASYALAIVAAEHLFGLLPRGTHDWSKFIPPEEVAKILESFNCRVHKIHGMSYLPVLDKWTWQENQSVNYALHAIKP